ncbi:DUF2381 family protein [Archangium violaceum]|uniref:DUF2381 family protein n=1 Tax=Archangium violaceum TaxID=83451 RepID=UPI00194F588C|nr:DUF2381 family protein [Archangium violaceum]QRN94695.1 DUF2381 family protein [Archangium violaceum]
MFTLLSAALLMMVLVAGGSAAAQTCPPLGEAEGRCIELTADGAGEVSEAQLSPGLATTFLFDSDVRADSVLPENREHFEVMDLGKRTLTLVPSERMLGKNPSTVTVCFASNEAPACATFRLLLHPSIGERQVRIFRHPRPVESIQAELKKAYAESAKLQAELVQMRAEQGEPGGLTGMFVSGMVDTRGIHCSEVRVVQRPGNALSALRIITCRARGRMVMLVDLKNDDAAPWMPQGARLTGPKGEELKGAVWTPEPVRLGKSRPLYIEVQAEDARTVGPFTLKLWEADGPRTVTLGNVAFPVLTEGPGL